MHFKGDYICASLDADGTKTEEQEKFFVKERVWELKKHSKKRLYQRRYSLVPSNGIGLGQEHFISRGSWLSEFMYRLVDLSA